jgi:hypothetical protein
MAATALGQGAFIGPANTSVATAGDVTSHNSKFMVLGSQSFGIELLLTAINGYPLLSNPATLIIAPGL